MSRIEKLVLLALMLFAILAWVPGAHGAEGSARKVAVRVSPTYPQLARRLNITGSVRIEVEVAPDGTVKSTKVIGGHPLLIKPALDALRKWKYEKAPTPTTGIVQFDFKGSGDDY